MRASDRALTARIAFRPSLSRLLPLAEAHTAGLSVADVRAQRLRAEPHLA